MDARQKQFDFNRAAKLNLLDKMILPRQTKKRGAALRIASLLRVVEGCIGDTKDQLCWASEQTIAQRMKISDRHVRRVLREAESLELIRSKRRGKQRTNLVAINWSKIWEMAGSPEPSEKVTGQQGHVTGQQGHVTGQQGHVTGQQGHVTGPHSPPIRSIDPIKKSATSSATQPAAGTCARNQKSKSNCNAASELESFEAVVVAMRNLEPEPVNGADSAVAEAKARGVSASELLRILRVAREAVCVLADGSSVPAWGAGAIRNRVAKARPGEDHSKLWPPPGEPFLKARQRLKQALHDQAAAQVEADRQALAASDQAQATARCHALEQAYGHDLDQLLCDSSEDGRDDALRNLIVESGDKSLIWLYEQRGPRSKLITRERLLNLLAQREAVML